MEIFMKIFKNIKNSLLLKSLFCLLVAGCTKNDVSGLNIISEAFSSRSLVPSFVNIELGLDLIAAKSKDFLSSCKQSTEVHKDDEKAGVVILSCEAMHQSVEKAKLSFFEGKLFKMHFFILNKNDMQERVRRAFIEKFGSADEDISKKQLSTGQYPEEVFTIPFVYNKKGYFEKWKTAKWRAYTASMDDKMFFVSFVDIEANDKLIKKLNKIESDRSKKDLNDLGI